MPDSSLGYFSAIGLGLVQGLTEFLPVSSSGHLALAAPFLLDGWKPPVLFDLLLHVATLFAVARVFWRDFLAYAAARPRVALWIAVACVPTAAMGLGFRRFLGAIGERPIWVCVLLLANAAILWSSRLFQKGDKTLEGLGAWRSLAVGAAQGLAIAPGISRSGATIVAGLAAGIDRAEAVKFSFALMVPAVLGATGLEAWSAWRARELAWLPLGPCLAGLAVAFLTGWAALGLLRRMVMANRLGWFALYSAAAGLAGGVYFLCFGGGRA